MYNIIMAGGFEGARILSFIVGSCQAFDGISRAPAGFGDTKMPLLCHFAVKILLIRRVSDQISGFKQAP